MRIQEWLLPQCRAIGRRKEGPTLGCLSVVWVEAKWDTRLEATENFWIPRAGFRVVGSDVVLGKKEGLMRVDELDLD